MPQQVASVRSSGPQIMYRGEQLVHGHTLHPICSTIRHGSTWISKLAVILLRAVKTIIILDVVEVEEKRSESTKWQGQVSTVDTFCTFRW